ncbi:CapA family protein [Lachnospiraceae bacterium 45-W7]
MKRHALGKLISLSVLLLIGLSLFFWVYYPKYGSSDEKDEIKTWEQLVEEEAAKKAEKAASVNLKDGQGEAKPQEGDGTGAMNNESGALENEGAVWQPQEAVLVFAGDIYLSPYVQENYDVSGVGGVISERLLSEMANADIVMANEEFPFSLGGVKAPDKQFNFRVDPLYTQILTDMGVDIVTLANNHALDYGAEALTDTFEALEHAQIAYVGAGADIERAMQPGIIQAGRQNYGFLAASRVIPVTDWNVENQQPGMLCTYDSKRLREAIKKAKEMCEFLTVYVHWGIEKSDVPEEYQRQLAREYIDAGADLVIGAHPHVLQGIEYYQGKPIVYSLGNYIFNQEIASTVLLKVRVTPEQQPVLQLLPASASGAKTQEMSGSEAEELYRYMESISVGVEIDADGVVKAK